MVKTRKISFAAAILILIIAVMPLLSLNAAASSDRDYFEGTITKSGTYKVALLDADLHDSDEGCLTSSQEKQLLNIMQETADKIKCNVGIAITSDLKRMSDVRYVKSFHAAMFGEYSDSVSLLLLNSHDKPGYETYEDQIYYTDRGYDLFNKRLNKLFDRIYDATGSVHGDYSKTYEGCVSFCSALTHYGTGLGSVLRKFNISSGTVLFALIAGTMVSIAIVMPIQKGYKKKKPISASHYIDKSRTRINRQVDQFVREYTTSVRIQSSSSGGGRSGGGGHRSGGGGGRHR